MAWANGAANPRTPIPRLTRRRILERDEHTCQLCHGARCGNRNLEVDHIGNPDDDSDTNLRAVGARPCHLERTHAQSMAARGVGPTRRRPPEPHPGAA